MDLLSVVLLLDLAVLQFGGVCTQRIFRYPRIGDDITLPCDKYKAHGPTCADVGLSHLNNTYHSIVVWKGQIQQSPRSQRLRFNSDCSLTIHSITEDDHGEYICELQAPEDKSERDTRFHLQVLSVSPAPSSLNQTEPDITLQCTLWGYFRECPQNSFRWSDGQRTLLSGESVTQNDCISNLTVERQSQHHRTFTCQFVEAGVVQTSAELRLERTSGEKVPEDRAEPKGNCEECQGPEGWSLFLVLKTVSWSTLICATMVVSIYTRQKEKPKRSSEVFEMIVASPDFNPGNIAPLADYENEL